MNKLKITKFESVLLVLIVIFSIKFTNAQFSFGASYGIQVPGRQDLKFRYYENGVLLENIKTTEVHSPPSQIFNLNLTYWKKKYGFRLDFFAWEQVSEANEFETEQLPPFFRVEQGRDAFYFSILRKVRFPFMSEETQQKSKSFSFFGVGIGQAITEVEQGRTQWRGAFKLSYSLSTYLTDKLSAQFEFNYLLTRDIDNLPNREGWYVDTSGRWFPLRFGPHWDTRFYAFQLGLKWDLF